MEYIANIVPHDMFSEYTYRTAILGPRPVLVNLMPIKVYIIAGWELFSARPKTTNFSNFFVAR